jgi:hypothetical protein
VVVLLVLAGAVLLVLTDVGLVLSGAVDKQLPICI